ncbi:MAG: bifunctional [glutamine synthetase] adenylyltransferase/[glutamine synthetase]-adenylyl-L-tyrosine phosphorylase [Rhodospirillum sp.]|nr:bifunctional [glutamine synthetase] adenylyltransferase/[glutamine synthetase]-adenylyl-L-tyrosine phosphorylase [Rhodospirillum sp.]MCF8490596.1 bifunctional [glutamine synthetase] adenylyltransferase/[glutamine synthetase]-adenylyl-L-tyrosine phosphorylase [Rhodospirillum sp.]MCF8498957.1 bifunctional [glutamine synthetase] adenylyltransferase/[glutamine synthetase]-adenylyl-L-tyrosine phosphorylase [Rhodospirillum sp.]
MCRENNGEEMQEFIFPGRNCPLPLPANPDRLELGLGRWRDIAGNQDITDFARAFLADPDGKALLSAIFGNSPFLSAALLKEPRFLARLARTGPDIAFAQLMGEAQRDARAATSQAMLMRALRIAKRRAALTIALADIAKAWTVERVTKALSDLAEGTLRLAVAHLLRERHDRGDLILRHPDDPERKSGFFVLGMGKLGGRELNYSSDIDLIVFYDPELADYRGKRSLKECYIALVRDLVRIMEERTADGYVFRTDLRLRPDPGSTAVAISVEAAEIYYETMGQNWERAAMIKARPVAGDDTAADALLTRLRPFIWRKYLDFNAIQDIHSIKRQIHASKGGARVGVAGHNIKLGRGGIREIEFFAQTQQLIWGGRDPRLRSKRTSQALADLVRAGLVPPETASDMAQAYRYLRTLEHRLQMIDDEQTQTLPKDPERLTLLALFMGEPDAEALGRTVTRALETVEGHYAHLFEDSPSLSSEGNLVFTGGEDDPETIETLKTMGFQNPEGVSATIRGWHHGRYNATRSNRARERLTELVPTLLDHLSKTAQPDTALNRFDSFLKKLPTGMQLFTLFQSNPDLLDLLAEIMGDAPRLSEHLARNPKLMDAVLTPGFFEAAPTRQDMAQSLDALLADAVVFEDTLDLVRRWANDLRFVIGLLALRGLLGPEEAGQSLSDVADLALSRLVPRVEAEFATQHGQIPDGALAVLALGKLGSREMTATSDLDLIVVYDAPPDSEGSGGDRPLAVTAYYIRLTQRIINAITALTAEGALYEVDMRLRPSGNKGPLATSLEAFRRYQSEAAWTWEHQALTRARVISGPPDLQARIEGVIRATLAKPRDPGKLAKDVADMRTRMDRDKPPASPWDVKLTRGGLVDVDFIAQYLQLRHAHETPGVLSAETVDALARLAEAGYLDPTDAGFLRQQHRRNLGLQATLRHSIAGQPREEDLTQGMRLKLARSMGQGDFEALKTQMEADALRTRALFDKIVGAAAAETATDPSDGPETPGCQNT